MALAHMVTDIVNAQEDDKHALVQHHLQKLRGKLNFKNLRMYVESYMKWVLISFSADMNNSILLYSTAAPTWLQSWQQRRYQWTRCSSLDLSRINFKHCTRCRQSRIHKRRRFVRSMTAPTSWEKLRVILDTICCSFVREWDYSHPCQCHDQDPFASRTRGTRENTHKDKRQPYRRDMWMKH